MAGTRKTVIHLLKYKRKEEKIKAEKYQKTGDFVRQTQELMRSRQQQGRSADRNKK